LLKCGLAASVTSCNFKLESWAWGCSKLGGVTSVTGLQCARGDLLVNFWSWWVAFKTLLAVLDQGPGYAYSFRRMALRARFYQDIFYSERALILAITIPSHRAGITWSLATTSLEGRGPAPGLHNDPSSSANRSVWRP
jgi:hypothetical protein